MPTPAALHGFMRPLATLLLGAALSQAAHAAPADTPVQAGGYGWLHGYAGKTTNAFMLDKRSVPLIRRSVPRPIAGDVIASLGGPADDFLSRQERYVFAAACRYRECSHKGFFWFDTRRGIGIGGYLDGAVLKVGSTSPAGYPFPPAAQRAIKKWLVQQVIVPQAVHYQAMNKLPRALAPAEFAALVAQAPGPSAQQK